MAFFNTATLKTMRCLASIAAAALVAAACVPIVDTRGHVETSVSPDELKIGTSTKEDVVKALGSPSSMSNFGDDSWYYISARKERKAFFKPELKDQNVVRITFDKEGVMSKIEKFDESSGQTIAAVEDVTPTEGHKLGVVEQILGNLGRFNKDINKRGGTATPSRPY